MSATSEKMKISFLANFDISYSAAFNASQKKKRFLVAAKISCFSNAVSELNVPI
jgi:hypothetical protein